MPDPSANTMPLPPDAYAAMALGLAILLEWLVPLHLLPSPAISGPLTATGVLLVAGGFALEIAAARTLAGGGASTRPNDSPAVLVTTGVFARSRNPFYLGLILVLAGVVTVFGLDWGLVLLPVLWACLNWLVVPFEERRLLAAFGHAFSVYRAGTRRWL